MELLCTNHLYCKESKCFLFQDEVEYLGHIVNQHGIRVDPTKVKAIQDWPIPQSASEVRAFLGLANFYCTFVHQFAKMAIPLTDLLNQATPFRWNEEQTLPLSNLKGHCPQPQCAVSQTYPNPSGWKLMHLDLHLVQSFPRNMMVYGTLSLLSPARCPQQSAIIPSMSRNCWP